MSADSTDPVIDPAPTPNPPSRALYDAAVAALAVAAQTDKDEASTAAALKAATDAHDAALSAESGAHRDFQQKGYAYISAVAAEWNLPLPPLPTVS